jgi:hypothetical protein
LRDCVTNKFSIVAPLREFFFALKGDSHATAQRRNELNGARWNLVLKKREVAGWLYEEE